MPAPAIKFCGLTDAAALEAAVAARAEYMGLMFFAPSPRNLSFAQARALAERAGERIARVGVFVDPDDALLTEAIAAGRLDVLQLHKATAKRRAEIRAWTRLPVWAVVPVRGPADFAARHHIDPTSADRILYDAATPASAANPGGMGLAFDWNLLCGLDQPLPWGLAGGLRPENVAEAVRITRAPLVDVSSGVESAPGVKDVDLIAAFAYAARGTT